jgi:hypothetical protein
LQPYSIENLPISPVACCQIGDLDTLGEKACVRDDNERAILR